MVVIDFADWIVEISEELIVIRRREVSRRRRGEDEVRRSPQVDTRKQQRPFIGTKRGISDLRQKAVCREKSRSQSSTF